MADKSTDVLPNDVLREKRSPWFKHEETGKATSSAASSKINPL
jgi:hypothetical protein